MCHWHLGDKDQAREVYARACRWMEGQAAADEDLRSFRAEAAALLGLRGLPPRPAPAPR
jgi:hypothetical protein